MSYIPITPFRRSMDATLIEHQKHASADLPPEGVNKFEVVRELTAARKALQVTDRELSVLQVLLSFYPKTILGGNARDLLVYPSNASICERLNGMPCSTMRRHLAGLVNAGLIIRRDSPNGKRYIKRYGDEPQAFGFDLTPLLSRYAEFCELAEAMRAEDEKFHRLRRTVSLMRRDLASLAEYGADVRPNLGVWAGFSDLALLTARDLRRKVTFDDLKELENALLTALNSARDAFEAKNTQIMSIKDVSIEHRIQNSNKDTNDSELNNEIDEETERQDYSSKQPNVPIGLVTAACGELTAYAPDGIKHWHQLVAAAEIVRPMMGISMSAWQDAKDAMGPEEAAVVVVAILERFSEIKSPGGYLRSLARKAEHGGFSCGPMIMALMNTKAA